MALSARNPPTPKQQLLPDANAGVAAIQTRRQLAVFRSIAFHVRIEQEQIAASNCHPPDFGMNGAAARLDLHHYRPAVFADRRFHGQLGDVGCKIFFLLPTVAIQALAEISLAVKQADADQRNAEIGRALDMVAGQDAEPAGIDGKRFVQCRIPRKNTPPARAAKLPRAWLPKCGPPADIPVCRRQA